MKKEQKTVAYDKELHIEAYHFQGITQSFPNHFHEHYAIGLMEGGQRSLSCKNKNYLIGKGDMILFNPGDNHTCIQYGEAGLYFREINISKSVMLNLAQEVTGKRELPGFSKNVVQDDEAACCLRQLHQMIMSGSSEFEKEEHLLLLISLVIQKYGQPFENCVPECREEIEKACRFMESHHAEHICLDEICRYAGLSKSTLLRAFTKSKGVTPYVYLETIRINKAKKLLEKDIPPVEIAMQTGFSDQSHFTNQFSSFIGLAPGVYREIFSKKKNKT